MCNFVTRSWNISSLFVWILSLVCVHGFKCGLCALFFVLLFSFFVSEHGMCSTLWPRRLLPCQSILISSTQPLPSCLAGLQTPPHWLCHQCARNCRSPLFPRIHQSLSVPHPLHWSNLPPLGQLSFWCSPSPALHWANLSLGCKARQTSLSWTGNAAAKVFKKYLKESIWIKTISRM